MSLKGTVRLVGLAKDVEGCLSASLTYYPDNDTDATWSASITVRGDDQHRPATMEAWSDSIPSAVAALKRKLNREAVYRSAHRDSAD